MANSNIQQQEVEWYRTHGKYPARIRRDNLGHEYVIGDWSWNGSHNLSREFIEDRMGNDLRRQEKRTR